MESSADQITRAVQLQYEKFPYPPVPLSTQVGGSSIAYSYLLAQYARIQRLRDPIGKRALVAGCGTGFEIHQVAASNPGLAEVVGIDLSHRSVEFSRERIRYHHLDHCRADVGNLLDPASLPAGRFEFIASYGVIHHTGDPVLALQNLADKLAPGGVMMLMLYNRSGRMPVYRIRQALSLLGIDQLPIEQGMELAWSLMEQAQPGTIFAAHSQGNREYYLQPENLVDNFFHANDIAYDIAEIPPLLAQAGLEFLDVVPHPYYWQPHQVIYPTYQEFYQRYQHLPRIQQLSLLESLNPSRQQENIFWCAHQGQVSSDPFSAETFLATHWQLSPHFCQYAQLEDGSPISALSGSSVAGDLRIRWELFYQSPEQTIVFNLEQIQILKILLIHPRQSGVELLASLPDLDPVVVMDWIRLWEVDRVILRSDKNAP